GLGRAAQAIGQSFSGMLSNVGAALSRLGAAPQKPNFESPKSVFPVLIGLLDQVTAAVQPVVDVFASRLEPAVASLAERLGSISFSTTSEGAASFAAALGPLLPLVGGLLGAVGPLLATLPGIGPLFAGLTGPVGLAAGA